MKKLKEIRQELQPIREKLETLRLQLCKKKKSGQALLAFPILLFIGAIVGFVLYGNSNTLTLVFVSTMVLSAFLLFFIYTRLILKPVQQYRKEFKSSLLKQIVHKLYPDMKYFPNKHISKKDFYSSSIFKDKADQGFDGEDYFEGVINKVPIRFSEINAYRLLGKNTVSLFNGIFMILDVKKEFTGETFILPDNFETLLGQFAVTLQAKLFQIGRGELLYLKDHPEFEKQFVIYSTNKIEAKNVLTKELLDNILWIRDKYNSELSISFQKGYVYLAIPMNEEGIFDPDINQSISKNDEMFNKIYAELVTSFRLIKHLPINHLNN